MLRQSSRTWHRFLLGAVLLAAAKLSLAAADDLPAFREVVDLLRTNLPDLTASELDRRAVEGLVERLHPRVLLVSTNLTPVPATNRAALKPRLFNKHLATVRLARVEGDVAAGLLEAWQALASTNAVKGLVLDLRFVGGTDYAGAAAVANLFLTNERPLVDWGEGMVNSTPRTNAITVPVAVVVNHQTAGAAEVLAALLRDTGAGLIIGTNTAGEATLARDLPLSGGERLRIAYAGIKLGSGKELSTAGVAPDLTVAVPPEEEKLYLDDPYRDTRTNVASVAASSPGGSSATNRPSRRRVNEAELVRARREGTNVPLDEAPPRLRAPEAPEVRDPALARALDLLTGLAVVREFQSK